MKKFVILEAVTAYRTIEVNAETKEEACNNYWRGMGAVCDEYEFSDDYEIADIYEADQPAD